jgi:signal transduction histidine kinase/CheY-like chemotaxis protein
MTDSPLDDAWLELYRIAFEHAPDPILVLDAAGRLVLSNREAQRWARALLGRLFDDRESRPLEIERFLGQLTVFERAYVETRIDGRTIAIEGRSHARWRVFAVRDVTDRRRHDAELRSLRRVESLGHFTASLIHDLNNLLTPIACLSACLEADLEGGASREMARDVRSAAEKAASLARQTLRWVRREPTRAEPIDPGAVLAEMKPLIQQVVGAEVRVDLRVAEGGGAALLDREGLEHALLNLAANARDAMPAGGRLTLSTTRVLLEPTQGDGGHPSSAGTHVVVRVEDTGIGMNRDVKERIFDRHFTTKEAGRGTGLGLAAVRGFVADSNGRLTVQSEEGRGATVSLFFPAVDLTSLSPPEPRLAPSGSETVLVVDDDDSVRGGMRAVLEGHGYRVLDAATSEDALAIVNGQGTAIDAAVVDVVMQEVSGLAFVHRAREREPLRVLFMSGHTEERLKRIGWRAGEGPLLRKAFTPSELLWSIRSLLDDHDPAAAPERLLE